VGCEGIVWECEGLSTYSFVVAGNVLVQTGGQSTVINCGGDSCQGSQQKKNFHSCGFKFSSNLTDSLIVEEVTIYRPGSKQHLGCINYIFF